MKILFVSKNLIGGDLARRLEEDGHNLRLYIEDEKSKHHLDGIVTKTEDWHTDKAWAKDGLIIFDDVGYGKVQDELRKEGFTVFGGSEVVEKLELDREYGQKIFQDLGLKTVPHFSFTSIKEALDFAKKNPSRWVIKQNDNVSKDITYVGNNPNGSDIISVLENYDEDPFISGLPISLHKFIDGVEIGVGRYFNGTKWIGPIEINLEHKRFFPGDLGPVTSEMGTLAWYSGDEKEHLFRHVLAPFEKFLKDNDFRGDFEINCIVNADGIFPLEATTRLGTPIIHLHEEFHVSPWAEFLYAVASGQDFDLKWKRGYGIVILLAVPPFPYTKGVERIRHAYNNISIYLHSLSQRDMRHFHFEDIVYDKEKNAYKICGSDGYVGYASGLAATVPEAQAKALEIIKKIIVPKVMYRSDIGTKFWNVDMEKLVAWGYLKSKDKRKSGDSKKDTDDLKPSVRKRNFFSFLLPKE